jgi:hypothetical protein
MAMLRSLEPNFRSGSKDEEFLISIVDEAHALINPEHVEGVGQFGFATAFGPQAYHIMRSSVISVFLMDVRQGFRDRENTAVADIKKWAGELGVETFETVSLAGNQFRCAGSKDYTDWVEEFLGIGEAVPAAIDRQTTLGADAPSSTGGSAGRKVSRLFSLEVEVHDTPAGLERALREKITSGSTARLLASYGRKWKTEGVGLPHQLPGHLMDFCEEYSVDGEDRVWSKIWNYVPKGSDYTHFIQAIPGSKMAGDQLCEVGCPYVVRGFDFDYVGLLWLSDLKWRSGKWVIDTDHVFERGVRRLISATLHEDDDSGPAHAALLRATQEAYRILLTRPLKGVFIWCEDDETRTHLEQALRIRA